jgi:lycopene cyclase domain-containing protein
MYGHDNVEIAQWDRAREIYYCAIQSEDSLKKAIEKFERFKSQSYKEGIITTYLGSLTTLKAKYALWPMNKLKFANEGLTMMDAGLVLIALAIVVFIDLILKTRLLIDNRFMVLTAVVVGLTLVFNTYLTARPVVLYNPVYQLNLRVITIPVEDLFMVFPIFFSA